MKQRLLWKCYLFLMVVPAIAVPTYFFLSQPEELDVSIEDVASIPFYITQLIGIYGLAYERTIGTRRSWKWIFVATVVDAVWASYSMYTEYICVAPFDMSYTFLVGFALGCLLFYGVLCLGLYKYSFGQSNIWAETT